VWILAATGRLLGGGWSPAARSAAKIHGFLLFSGGGRCPFDELNFGAPHWILGGGWSCKIWSVIIITPPWQTNRAQPGPICEAG
jgi:hypothetical protein